MFNFLKEGINFIKKNPGILYSLFLIIFLPLALFLNTFFSIKSFQENIDYTLKTNALLIENILGSFTSDLILNPKTLQEKIIQIAKENPEISGLRIVLRENDQYVIIASQKPEEIESIIRGGVDFLNQITLAWNTDMAIAYLTLDEKGTRLWRMVKPLKDLAGNKIGIITLSMSLERADLLMKKVAYQAYVITFLAILLTLFLIIHHTKLFGYVTLSKRLQEIDRAKDEFIRMATHELQGPIANIKGYITILEEEISGFLNEVQKEYLARVILSARNLSDLISDILEVSRIEQGRLDFTPQKIFPPLLIEEVAKEIKLKAEKKNLSLILELDEKPCQIFVNPNRFRQILNNLLENSLKYTFEGGISIKTSCDENKKRYIIEIKDTGIGISAEDQTRLFEKFYRVKSKETAGIPGTGLGLWITKQLTEKMGGKIFLESIEKVGTKFVIIFPLIKG